MAATAFAFDLDGTLCDSRPYYASILSELTEIPAKELEARVGVNVVRLVGHLGVSRARFFSEARRRTQSLHLYPGVTETLGQLHSQRLPMGIASSLPRPLVMALLDGSGLTQFFRAIVAYEAGVPAKPNPASVSRCLDQIGVTPSRTVFYVGDRDVDREAALSAGIRFVWAKYGYGAGEVASSDDVRITRFSELLRL